MDTLVLTDWDDPPSNGKFFVWGLFWIPGTPVKGIGDLGIGTAVIIFCRARKK